MREFLNNLRRFSEVGSRVLNWTAVILVGTVLLVQACASMNTYSIYMDGYQGGVIEDTFVDMIRESGYTITRDRSTATHVARVYHQGHTNYCNGSRGYYIRARLVVNDGVSAPLDMSSTIECARDPIAGELELQNRVDMERATYVRRLRAY